METVNSEYMSLEEFRSNLGDWFVSGTWRIQYNDRTHLPHDSFINIGDAVIEQSGVGKITLFNFKPNLANTPSSAGKESPEEVDVSLQGQLVEAWKKVEKKGNPKGESQDDKKARFITEAKDGQDMILDQVSESLMRLGIMRPALQVSDDDFYNRKFAVVVMDTTSLRDGSIRHLIEQCPRVSLWVTIPLVTLMESGERIAQLTSLDRKGSRFQNYKAVRIRPQATIIPQEISWIQNNLPHEKLELASELLRNFRGFDPNPNSVANDPERFTINDRLILEGIKDLRRQRGLSGEIYLMTGDKDMARLARLERINTIYAENPNIDQLSGGVTSIRYSLDTRTFIACSFQRFLCDLTHVFSKIRAECIDGERKGRWIELCYYYPSKLVNEWLDGKLQVTCFGPSTTTDAA